MSEIVVRTFDLGMLDDCVDLYMKTYSQEPWNETWDSRDVVASFYKNHYANNYFLGFAAVRDGEIVGVSVGFLKPYIKRASNCSGCGWEPGVAVGGGA